MQFDGQWVTPNTFEFLGMQPLLGRMITRADGETGAAPVFAMSHRLWKKQFNSDPSLVGKTLVLNGEPRTLVSVMPPRFLLGERGHLGAQQHEPQRPRRTGASNSGCWDA